MSNVVAVTLLLLGVIAAWSPAAGQVIDPDSVMAPGYVFRDCTVCPEMIIVPAGVFIMGSPESEEERLQFLVGEEGEIAIWAIGGEEVEDTQEFQSIPEGLRLVEPEGPQRYVTIARPLAVATTEVTFSEWDACARGWL